MRWTVGSGAVLAVVGCGLGSAWAQDVLPEIVVTAESPLRRTATEAPGGPVIADTFAPTTVVTAEELRAGGGATLGDALGAKPGVTTSGFAPGAASRPIIRGLDNYRVRIQENGVGSGDVSALGEDHGVPLDPLAADKIEVVRGPATLRYGSQAIGGVVDATNTRILEKPVAGGWTGELRGGVSSVDRGRDGLVRLDASNDRIGVHLDAWSRASGDYATPDGRQANSSARASGGAVGLSWFFENGFAGLSLSHHKSLYEVPGLASAADRTRIDLAQTKLTGRGELRLPGHGIEAVRWWFGVTNYTHSELGPDPMAGFGPLATFRNREQEARVEVLHRPFDTPFGALRGAAGVQAGWQALGASGEAGGLIGPSFTRRIGGYVFEELELIPGSKLQAAARVESARVSGEATDFPPTFLPPPDDPATAPARRSFLPVSLALGFQQRLPWDLVASVNAQYVERAPQAPELFSRGVHEATGTFEIGDPNLGKETARSIEVSLKRQTGALRFEATAYMTKFRGFIFKRLTGVKCDDAFSTCGAGTELDQVVYSQQDATFHGLELAGAYDVGALGNGVFGVDGQFDLTRARFADGTNVPRIPPARFGAGVFWRNANFMARVSLLHAFAQNRIAANETPTAGYNLLNAELRYTRKVDPRTHGVSSVEVALTGTNLLDERIRNHVSFRKNEVLAPGRGARLSATVRF